MIFTASGAASGVTSERAKPRSSRLARNSSQTTVLAGLVAPHAVVVGERVAEEVGAVDATLDRGRLVLVQHHRQHDGDRSGSRRTRPARTRPTRSARSTPRPSCPASSGSTNENDSAPMPLRAANWIVSRRLQATQSGGCGFCSGFGTTLRGGMLQNSLVPAGERLLDEHPRDRAHGVLPHRRACGSRSTRKPPSSAADDDSPVPNSTRPSEIRSSVAIRSATRAGWLTAGGSCTMPCPSRIRCVRAAAAARNTSGADECEYSSRKWCSTSQT